MNFEVDNNLPELKDAYQGMAWSCLTRNRDNNGNGKIDRKSAGIWHRQGSLSACG